MAAASGEIEAKPTNAVTANPTVPGTRSSSVPPTPSSESRPPITSSASQLHRQAVNKPTNPSAPTLTRTKTDQFFADAQLEDDEVDEAWGEMGGESFFDAPAQPVTSPTPFDDGGEPDFAGWLNAQAQSKIKSPLPKGLSKPTTSRPTSSASKSAVVVGGKKVVPKTLAKEKEKPKVIDTKPKETAGDDDWGEAWD